MLKVLLIDDEPDILEFLSYNLRGEGYDVHTAAGGRKGIDIALQEKPDVTILDIMMPEIDGVETCIRMRQYPELQNMLIVFLTARSEDYSQIAALDAGGDDYVTKPVKPRVLISRIKALIRRSRNAGDVQAADGRINGIQLNKERYSVLINGVEYDLPKKEFELLDLLMSRPGKVFTRKFILESVWGEDVYVNDRTIDVHIRKLRRKLGNECIRTLKGVGYKIAG